MAKESSKNGCETTSSTYTGGMGRSLGFVMLLIVVGIGGYIYSRQAQSLTAVGSNPQTTVDVTGVHNDLIALASAERRYFASNAKYASLDDLRTSGDIALPHRANYSYSAQTSDSSFKIIAAYSGSDPKAPKRIIMDESMTMTTE
jgi:hypothetical protein